MDGKLNFSMGRDRIVAEGVVFEPGNAIAYGQDFRHTRGIPAGIPFTVQEHASGYMLRGPGYGDPGNYGDGALFVAAADSEPIRAIIRAEDDLKALADRCAAQVLREVASIIETAEVMGDYVGTDERWVPDFERTLAVLAQSMIDRAEAIDSGK